ncbi:hypothetical protein [Robertmurraya kyonggiensis]|uniref:TrbL/VirB6 plasmid conjugal transfer protein n=1 Tax=Robertmurraya kyonggiensis TaxID=1037680 RepID=A0A4U1D0A7_9BACI|nr:hypothetical protein [Robertmurraya kyonggiensis]TKC15148.1 hypothetical protein FA727_19895 [Robertmurraya kyonggiensis]
MKLVSFAESKQQMRKIYILLTFVILLIVPTPAFAAESEKWYMKPFEWMLGAFFEYILAPVAGIHEPAHYIFYQGDGLIWGMYNEEQFNNAVQAGYNMMLVVVSFMLVGAIIKMAIQNSYGKFSSSMQVDMMDNGFKILIALVLIFQFFTIVNIFFTLNVYGVNMFEKHIQDPTSLVDMGADALTKAGEEQDKDKELSFTDLDGNEGNPIKTAIVSFFSFGVALWFKAYYIQRMFFITGLIILAPIWLSTLFFPKLQGITSTAFKELWAQIISQTIHAAVFFVYYWLFDGMSDFNDWLTYILALSIFIPVSESIRFAMGATSDNAGKMATIGTLAGAGSLMHMMKAGGEIKNGFKNAFMERKGVFDGQNAGGNGNGSSIPGMGFAKENADRQYGGSANLNGSPNKFARNMRSFGHVAAGFGSAMMRTGGFTAGMGINPLTGHLAAEGGAQVGKEGGYGAGVLSYAGGKGIVGKGKNALEGFKSSYDSSRENGGNAFQATMSGLGGGMKEGAISTDARTNPVRRNELAQKIGGALGEASYGRGVGYQMGSEMATNFAFKGNDNVDVARLDDKQKYAVVTSNRGSYLAQMGPNNKMIPITNMKPGDANLANGQMVIQEYQVSTSETGIRSFQPQQQQYSIRQVNQGSNQGSQFARQKVATPAKQPNIQEFITQKPN